MAQVDALIVSGRTNVARHFAKRAATASDAAELSGIEHAVKALCSGGMKISGRGITFREFAERWLSGDLHREHPQRVPFKRTAHLDRYQVERYVNPVVGDVPLVAFTMEHAEDVMRRLPLRLSSASCRHIAQALRRVLTLAVFPAQIIDRSPLARGFLPKVERRKAFSYLFPDEDATLLACSEVELGRRVLYGVLVREGLRAGEAFGLSWRDLDLSRGIVRLDTNKTEDPRVWALGPGVSEALTKWRELHPNPSNEVAIFVSEDGMPLKVRADDFRADLKLAGITRPQLFERSESRRPIRLHDLRATFVTLSLASGKSETWVADRTGHRSSEMINRYRRPARTHQELGLGELTPLASAVPELRSPQGGHQLGTNLGRGDRVGLLFRQA